jgi:hypothetical protein
MTKLVRLLDEEGVSDLERRVLASAEDDPMPAAGTRDRTLAAILAVPAATVATTAAVGAGGAGKALMPAIAKWILLSALAIGVTAEGVHLARPSRSSVQTSAQTTAQTAPQTVGSVSAAVAPIASDVPIVPSLDDSSLHAASAPGKAKGTVSRQLTPKREAALSLHEEADLLENVREAIATSRTSDAAHLLDRYDAQFQGGALAPEALVLRVQMDLARGDRAAARALADRFERAHPTSSYVPKLRRLLSRPE